MTRRVVTTARGPVTIALDDAVRAGDRFCALVQARLVDERTGQPVTEGVQVEAFGTPLEGAVGRRTAWPRAGSGGVVGVVGIPSTVLPALDIQAYDLGVRARASGYLPAQRVLPHGPLIGYPDRFVTRDLGDLLLHGEPIVVLGQVLERLGTGVIQPPAAPVTVGVTEAWRRIPPMTSAPGPLTSELAAISPLLYADRSSATTVLRRVGVAANAGSDRVLLSPVSAGRATVRLGAGAAIAVNDLLEIDGMDADRIEHVMVAAVDATTDPTQAVTVTLHFPLVHDHATGALTRTAVATPVLPDHALAEDAIAGDATLFLPAGTGLMATVMIEIDDGGPVHEYHQLDPYLTQTDPDGFYRLPPLGRVAALSVEAVLGPRVLSQTSSPAFHAQEHRVDFLFQ